jgi:hypothetical protein
MTFRQQIQRRVTLAPALYMTGIFALVPIGIYLWFTQRYEAQFYVWSVGLAVLLAVVSILLWIRCPRCHARLPWPSDRVARDYAIQACSCCGVKFDLTLLRRQLSSDTTIRRADIVDD